MREGGRNCLKYLKGSGTKEREGETKILKSEDKLGQGVGALKRGGCNPLMNYDERIDLLITASANIYQTKIPIVMKICFS